MGYYKYLLALLLFIAVTSVGAIIYFVTNDGNSTIDPSDIQEENPSDLSQRYENGCVLLLEHDVEDIVGFEVEQAESTIYIGANEYVCDYKTSDEDTQTFGLALRSDEVGDYSRESFEKSKKDVASAVEVSDIGEKAYWIPGMASELNVLYRGNWIVIKITNELDEDSALSWAKGLVQKVMFNL